MIMLKDLTEEKIEKLSDTQLYNLTFAPLIQDVREIDSFTQKQMDESAICVYGATIKPIKTNHKHKTIVERNLLIAHNSLKVFHVSLIFHLT